MWLFDSFITAEVQIKANSCSRYWLVANCVTDGTGESVLFIMSDWLRPEEVGYYQYNCLYLKNREGRNQMLKPLQVQIRIIDLFLKVGLTKRGLRSEGKGGVEKGI